MFCFILFFDNKDTLIVFHWLIWEACLGLKVAFLTLIDLNFVSNIYVNLMYFFLILQMMIVFSSFLSSRLLLISIIYEYFVVCFTIFNTVI